MLFLRYEVALNSNIPNFFINFCYHKANLLGAKGYLKRMSQFEFEILVLRNSIQIPCEKLILLNPHFRVERITVFEPVELGFVFEDFQIIY